MPKFLLRPVFFYKLHKLHGTPTFKNEALHFVSNVQLVKHLYCEMNGKYGVTLLLFGSNSQRASLLRPPINSIDTKCHTEKLKGSRTCLIGYSDFISHEEFLIAQGRTHTHTRIPTSRTKTISRTRCAPGLIMSKMTIRKLSC